VATTAGGNWRFGGLRSEGCKQRRGGLVAGVLGDEAAGERGLEHRLAKGRASSRFSAQRRNHAVERRQLAGAQFNDQLLLWHGRYRHRQITADLQREIQLPH
jgi:hypothetical protein